MLNNWHTIQIQSGIPEFFNGIPNGIPETSENLIS